MIMYILSILVSVFDLIMITISLFADPENSYICKHFGDDEAFILLGISIVMIIVGFIFETRKEKEIYG